MMDREEEREYMDRLIADRAEQIKASLGLNLHLQGPRGPRLGDAREPIEGICDRLAKMEIELERIKRIFAGDWP